MDIEHLKLVVDLLQGVTDGALYACIAYIAASFLINAAWVVVFLVVIFCGRKVLETTISNNLFVEQIKQEFGFDGWLSSGEKRKIMESIRKGRAGDR